MYGFVMHLAYGSTPILQSKKECIMASCCILHKHAVGGYVHFTVAIFSSYSSQIEFYFGDANLPKDKFLQQKISENPDGCKHVASFPARASHCPLAVCKNRGRKPGLFYHMNDVK